MSYSCLQYIIANLGISTNFGDVDIEHLRFPTTMRVDWIRVYQPKDSINIGCDPTDFPTQTYINRCAHVALSLHSWLTRLMIGILKRIRIQI
jgi:hypothetical protein